MKSMAKNHPSTSGLRFIRDNLHRVASTDTTFIELIEILASSDAGQNVLNSLSKVAEENLEIAKTLYCRLKNSNDEKLRRLCVYLLGGIGRVHPSYLIQEIETNMSSPDTISKVNYLRALQIAFANNPDINSISNRIVEFAIDCTTGGDTLLQHDAIIASLILLKLHPTRLRPPILRFVKKSEENRIFICGLFGVRSINTEDEDLELELLDICLNSDSADAVYAAFDAVAFELYKSKLDKIKLQRKTLATVKRWGKCKDYLGVHHQWLLELIGTVDSDYAINFVQDWIQEEEDPRALKIYI